MKLEILSESHSGELLQKTALLAYSEGFRSFCRRQYNAESFFVGLWEGGGLKAVLPVFKRSINGQVFVEIPTPIYYAEPVLLDADFKFKPRVWAKKIMDFFGAGILEMNLYELDFQGGTLFNGFKNKFTAYVLDIGAEKDADKILATVIDKKTRNQIRAGAKSGLVTDRLDVDFFYSLYQKHRKRLGVGERPRSYFYNLAEAFGDRLVILGTKHGERLIGANLFVVNKNYLWLINNIFDPEYAGLYPSNFVYWEMIKWGLARGIRYFDYGGGPTDDAGLIHFKEGFGGKPHPLYSAVFYKSTKARFKYWLEQKTRHLKQGLSK